MGCQRSEFSAIYFKLDTLGIKVRNPLDEYQSNSLGEIGIYDDREDIEQLDIGIKYWLD